MNFNNRYSERGNISIALMVILAFITLTVMTLMASDTFRERRSQDMNYVENQEKWAARSNVNILAQVVKNDASKQLNADVFWVRENCSAEVNTEIFDDINPSNSSSPAATFESGTLVCVDLVAPSSIFGQFENWRDGRIMTFKETAVEQLGVDPEIVDLIEFDEIYRRQINEDTAYIARFIVEGKVGNYRTRTNGEIVLGNDIPGCGISVILEISPTIVTSGQPIEITVNYIYARKIQIFDSSNSLVHEENVSETSARETFIYSFTPAATETYRVVAIGSGGCQAVSSEVEVTVRPIVCPSIIEFSSSATTINAGESVTFTWNVQDAASVTLNGVAVSSTGSQSFTLNSTQTFTLSADNASNSCPISQQITVTVRVTPPCSFSAPQIADFTASPSSISTGETSDLSWNVSGMENGGSIVMTGAGGVNQSISFSGSLVVTPPSSPGNYQYVITAENICPDGTRLTTQKLVTISVQSCPPPIVNSFTASPTTVIEVENRLITLSWNISGTTDTVSINNGVGGGLPASGSVDIPQPSVTTTYRITVLGCGLTRSAQLTVTVVSCDQPGITSFSASPSTVQQGGNQDVTFSWNASDSSGTGATVRIRSGATVIATGLALSGTHTIPQPQNTQTYVLEIENNCGNNVMASVTVTVDNTPTPSGTVAGCTYIPPAGSSTISFDYEFDVATAAQTGGGEGFYVRMIMDAHRLSNGNIVFGSCASETQRYPGYELYEPFAFFDVGILNTLNQRLPFRVINSSPTSTNVEGNIQTIVDLSGEQVSQTPDYDDNTFIYHTIEIQPIGPIADLRDVKIYTEWLLEREQQSEFRYRSRLPFQGGVYGCFGCQDPTNSFDLFESGGGNGGGGSGGGAGISYYIQFNYSEN